MSQQKPLSSPTSPSALDEKIKAAARLHAEDLKASKPHQSWFGPYGLHAMTGASFVLVFAVMLFPVISSEQNHQASAVPELFEAPELDMQMSDEEPIMRAAPQAKKMRVSEAPAAETQAAGQLMAAKVKAESQQKASRVARAQGFERKQKMEFDEALELQSDPSHALADAMEYEAVEDQASIGLSLKPDVKPLAQIPVAVRDELKRLQILQGRDASKAKVEYQLLKQKHSDLSEPLPETLAEALALLAAPL